MAADEEILKLFDTYWFEQEIFRFSANVTAKDQVQENTHEIQESVNLLKGISQSDYCLRLDNTSFSPLENSPTSVIITHNRIQEPIKGGDKKRRWIKRRVKEIIRIRRSSSDLELEELKGFMDFGFEFNEEDKNSRLVTIVPGLEKWRKRGEEIVENSKKRDVNSRPYLSEAWEILEKGKISNKLLKWRFPALYNEINMKDNLRVWAQTVASTFR